MHSSNALATAAGPLSTWELEKAWSDACKVVAGEMIKGARLATTKGFRPPPS